MLKPGTPDFEEYVAGSLDREIRQLKGVWRCLFENTNRINEAELIEALKLDSINRGFDKDSDHFQYVIFRMVTLGFFKRSIVHQRNEESHWICTLTPKGRRFIHDELPFQRDPKWI
jgi:hypothetical protein